jgi:hypothetical protein
LDQDAGTGSLEARVLVVRGRSWADEHVLEALSRAEESLADAHRQLMQGTYFAVPERDNSRSEARRSCR